jgi:hypothetical protein
MPKFPTDAPRVRVIKGSTLRLILRQAEITVMTSLLPTSSPDSSLPLI